MEDKKRPWGLTALAVVNFIFAGLAIIGVIGLVSIIMLSTLPADQIPEAQKAQLEAFTNMGTPMFSMLIATNVLSFILLLLSGIGYLKLKKILGRMMGNIYGIIGVLYVIISVTLISAEMGGGFNIGTILNLGYPVLTLILLNTIFKDDLVN
jgi:hypothetical protein